MAKEHIHKTCTHFYIEINLAIVAIPLPYNSRQYDQNVFCSDEVF